MLRSNFMTQIRMDISKVVSLIGEILILVGTVVLFFQFEEREDIASQIDDGGNHKPWTVLFKNKKVFVLGIWIFVIGEALSILSYFINI